MDAADEHPRFTTRWANYQKHGTILLSDDRGQKKHTGLAVYDDLPADVFESPELVDWDKLPQSAVTQIGSH
jgi:hypothetical protein